MNRLSRTSLSTLAASSAALLLLACGGGSGGGSASSPAASQGTLATSLAYTDPASNSWRLVKDPVSTATHLVLDLVGPAGTSTRGVAFNLQSDPSKMAWGKQNNGYIEDLGVFELAADPTNPNEPKLLLGGFRDGMLSVADVQKIPVFTAKDAGQALFRVAIDFNTIGNLHAGDAVPLSVSKAKTLQDDFTGAPISIAVGTLVGR